jgi:hypothetical protein
MNLEFIIPPDLTFEDAIALTQSLLNSTPDEELLGRAVEALIATPNGARGFLVVFLTEDYPMPPGFIMALRSNPHAIANLMAKNLIMPAAMALTHRRNGNDDLADSSDRTRDRAAHLIQQLNLPELRAELMAILSTIETTIETTGNPPGTNDWNQFLDRWGYDDEQRDAIGKTIQASLAAVPS